MRSLGSRDATRVGGFYREGVAVPWRLDTITDRNLPQGHDRREAFKA